MFTKRSNRHSNRRASSQPTIEPLEGRRLLSADLAPLFSELPLNVNPGTRNHVAVEVVNDGNSTAAGTVIVDLCAQSTSGGPAVLLDEVTRNMSLKAGREGMVNFRFGTPPDLADGSYNLVAQLSTETVNDAIRSNDVVTSAAPVTIAQPFSDVTTESVNATAQSFLVNSGQTRQRASITLENNGNVPARGRISIAFYLSQGSILDGQAVQAGTLEIPINLRPGQARIVRSPISAPAGMAGQYYLFAATNPAGGNVQTLPGHGVGIAVNQVNVTVNQKIVVFLPRICYSGPDYECTPGDVGGVECAEPPVENPPIDSGPTDSGSPDVGPTNGGSTDTTPTSVPTDGGSTDNDSPISAPTDGGSTDNGSPTSAPADGGSIDNGSTDNGSTDGGSSDNGSYDAGSTDSGSTDNGSDAGGSTDDGSTDSGSTDSGSTDDGSTDSSSTDDGSDDSGSTDDGSGDDSSEESFIARRSVKSVSLKEHSISHAMPSRPVKAIARVTLRRAIAQKY